MDVLEFGRLFDTQRPKLDYEMLSLSSHVYR